MEEIEREIITLMYDYNVEADETVEDLAKDIIDIIYTIKNRSGTK